ncbi:hypothetical protein [Actinomadura monticuli]|uniref:DUF5667 domain-containing protein n=1 Tax=Actinomadura monticuli TaxID=3097367 RepID=A0ABV4Q3P7_9ACTN
MQCPTCGNDTPGTLGKCSHCAAPIDVYSVGPAVPLGAPVTDTPPAGGALGSADVLGDRTMMVPPPQPAWAPSSQPPAVPDFSMPGEPLASPSPASHSPAAPDFSLPAEPLAAPSPASPSWTAPEPPAQPPLRLTAEASAEASAVTPAAASPLPSVDPEDTAAWTFNPDEDSGAYGTVPPPPAWGAGRSAPPASEPAASGGAGANPFGLADHPEPTESIVPDSWFAQPRRPEVPDADATQVWGQQGGAQQPALPSAMPPALPDAEATQIAPASMNPGPMSPGPMNPGPMNPGGQQFGGPQFGGNLDQTRMDPGALGGPPMNPMGPMGQPGMAPMGPMGPGGDPGYGGFPPPRGGKAGGTSKPLIAAVAALVTVAAGAVIFVAWPSGDGSSASTNPTSAPSSKQVAQKNAIPPETKQQAATLNKILDDSVATRRVLAGALGRAGKCKTLPQAIQGFQTVAQRRQDQLQRTRDLRVDKLANGERLRGSLSEALTASLRVDQVLLQWAQANQSGCRGKPKPSAAQVPGRAVQERRATSAKKQFVVLWNPVAKKTGQPQRSWKRV